MTMHTARYVLITLASRFLAWLLQLAAALHGGTLSALRREDGAAGFRYHWPSGRISTLWITITPGARDE